MNPRAIFAEYHNITRDELKAHLAQIDLDAGFAWSWQIVDDQSPASIQIELVAGFASCCFIETDERCAKFFIVNDATERHTSGFFMLPAFES